MKKGRGGLFKYCLDIPSSRTQKAPRVREAQFHLGPNFFIANAMPRSQMWFKTSSSYANAGKPSRTRRYRTTSFANAKHKFLTSPSSSSQTWDPTRECKEGNQNWLLQHFLQCSKFQKWAVEHSKHIWGPRDLNQTYQHIHNIIQTCSNLWNAQNNIKTSILASDSSLRISKTLKIRFRSKILSNLVRMTWNFAHSSHSTLRSYSNF